MRVWDLSPGYLNRQSLLAEHRELHGIHAILIEGKKGYSRHPETLRWVDALGALVARHDHLAAEMRLRGYVDRTPLVQPKKRTAWPGTFVTEPTDQIALLRQKYAGKDKGRIALPRNPQELWAQHKYSVMARSPEVYRRIGRSVSRMRPRDPIADLLKELVAILRGVPGRGGVTNAVEHMWGHVRRHATAADIAAAKEGPPQMLLLTQRLAMQRGETFLVSSTALSDLAVFLDLTRGAVP